MKSMPLEPFLRSYPLRGCEITRVARSMDENELEIDMFLTTKSNGIEKYFDIQMHFVGIKVKEMPYAKMVISRCRVIGNTFEMTTDKNAIADVSFRECTVRYPDDFDDAFRR